MRTPSGVDSSFWTTALEGWWRTTQEDRYRVHSVALAQVQKSFECCSLVAHPSTARA